MKLIFNKITKLSKSISGEIPEGWIDKEPTGIKPVWSENDNNWVESATQDEIEQHQKQKQQEQFQQFKQKLQNDGQSYYNEIDLQITMQFYGRPQIEINPLVAEVDTKIMPVMDLVKSGQWYSAMMKITTTELPNNQEVLNGFNEVKSFIINYVQENYN